MGDERISYLYEPSGSELHWDGLKQKTKDPMAASLSSGSGLMGSKPAPVQAQPKASSGSRELTEEEMLKYAHEMALHQEAQNTMLQHDSLHERNDAGGQVPDWLHKYMGR